MVKIKKQILVSRNVKQGILSDVPPIQETHILTLKKCIGCGVTYNPKLVICKNCDRKPKREDSNSDHKKSVGWSKAQKRTYRNICAGLQAMVIEGKERVGFLTLTTSLECLQKPNYDKQSGLTRDAVRLRQRMARMTPYKFYKLGYLSKRQLPHFYDRDSYFKPFGKMEYQQVYTDEGNGVIHILGDFPFIPQAYISDVWSDVHSSEIVDLRSVSFKDGSKKAARYIVAQYTAGQDTSYIRSSLSRGWVYEGWRRDWKDCWDSSRDWQRQYVNQYGIWVAPPDYKLFWENWKTKLKESIDKKCSI